MQYSRNTYANDQYGQTDYSKLPPINQQRYSDNFQQPHHHDFEEKFEQSDDEPYQQKYSMGQSNQGNRQTYQNNGNYGNNNGALDINDIHFDAGEGFPIQIVSADPRTGHFELKEEDLDDICQLEGNVAFVCLAGKYRTGKSYLLNKVLNLRGTGFTVDPTTDACTQGIWMWSQPVYIEKDNLHIFFLDTEGSHSIEKSSTHDAKIFSLACLMSSLFIYNSVGVIDENSINELSLATQLSKNIAISAEEANSEGALSYYTPSFLWCLRDFTLELQDARGKPISAAQYLENALTDLSTVGKTSETNKKIRTALLNYFKDRDCMVFVRPANSEKELQRLNDLPDQSIRPEFLKQVNALRDKVLTKAKPKQLKGVNLNPRMYVAMVKKYVDAINEGQVPNISTAWEHLMENEALAAYDEAIQLYEIALRNFFLNEDRARAIEDVYNILKNIRDSALEKFHKIAASVEKSEYTENYKSQLKDFIEQKENAAISINEELNRVKNEEILVQLSTPIRDKLTTGIYDSNNISNYFDDMNKLLTEYDEQANGIGKSATLVRFLGDFHARAIETLFQSFQAKHRRDDKAVSGQRAKTETEQQQLMDDINMMRTQNQNKNQNIENLKKDQGHIEKERADIEKKLNDLKNQQEQLAEDEIEKVEAQLKGELEKKELELKEVKEKNEKLAEEAKKPPKSGCCNIF